MTSGENAALRAAWEELKRVEKAVWPARGGVIQAFADEEDAVAFMRQALHRASDRATALRLFPSLLGTQREALFADVLDEATVGHRDIGEVHAALHLFGPDYFDEHAWPILQRHLEDDQDDEVYRSLARLLDRMRSVHLPALVERAARSSNPHVREVAEDYAAEPR